VKIAFVYDVIYPYVVGGGQKRIWEIASRLSRRGHEVHVFGMKHWEGEEILMKEGVILHGFCQPKALYTTEHRSINEAIKVGYQILTPLLKEKFDIIDCMEFPYFTCFSAKLCSIMRKTPLILTWLELWNNYWFEYMGIKGIFGKATERLVLKLPNSIIAISEKVKKDLVTVGVKSTNIHVVPDGVDFSRIQAIEPLGNNRHDVLYSGRLIEHKNVDVLIKAIALIKSKIPEIKCGIIGDGPEMGRLQSLTSERNLGDNIKFLGFLEKDTDVYSHMKSARIFVLPSTREGAGLVTLEANVCGLPVVTIDQKENAATEVVIDGENGFLCQLSEEDLAATILVALDKSHQMRDKCIEFGRRYDWSIMAALTESVYQTTIVPDR